VCCLSEISVDVGVFALEASNHGEEEVAELRFGLRTLQPPLTRTPPRRHAYANPE